MTFRPDTIGGYTLDLALNSRTEPECLGLQIPNSNEVSPTSSYDIQKAKNEEFRLKQHNLEKLKKQAPWSKSNA